MDELVWQSRWFSGDFGREFVTTAGEPVSILDFGWWNHGAGPDFRDCVIRISGENRRGSIELDPSVRDWEAHGHGASEAYDDTVLHLYLTNPGPGAFFTRTSGHREIPQVQLEVTGGFPAADERGAPSRPGRCVQYLASLPEPRILEILEDAARFRLEMKGRRWRRIAGIHGLDQAIFQGMAEALGYSRNKLPMSVLAQRLPLKFLQGRPGDAEALLFGVAGFLNGREADHGDSVTRAWLRGLWSGWWKYRAGFTPGHPVPPIRWTLSGTRPVNHPQRRVAALRQIVDQWPAVRAQLEPEAFHEKTFTALLESLTHPYWSTHYTLTARPSGKPLALLGRQRIQEILANLVYPLLLAERPALWEAYRRLPAPGESAKTVIAGIRLFGQAEKAAAYQTRLWQQQALLQIYQDFCLRAASGCAGCPFPGQV